MKSSLSIRSVTAAFLSSVTSRPETTPTGTPAIFTSSPCDEVGGVVEDRADEVVLERVVVARLAHDADHDPGHDRHEQADVDQPPHGVAAGVAAAEGERRRAVGAGLDHAARAAVLDVGLEAVELLRRIGRGERPARVVRRQEHRLDAGVVAVGVVVGGDLPEVGDPGREVGRVAAEVLEHRLRLVERLDRAREHRGGQLRQARLLRGQLDQVVVRARRADQLAQVGDRRTGLGEDRPQLAQEARQVLRGRLRLRRPAGRGRRASSAGSRTSCWPCAACSAAARARGRARRSRRRSPGTRCWCSRPGRPGRRGARRSRRPSPRCRSRSA